ncbi:hypothetical protein GCM10009864_53950 [Streptomyces lunalinharesii]|uniref:Uncharacterized protein n=1 Tax=Streptomyces lunalinharesii TaxID=333384 RepID=A0ABN3SH20_9ACTN
MGEGETGRVGEELEVWVGEELEVWVGVELKVWVAGGSKVRRVWCGGVVAGGAVGRTPVPAHRAAVVARAVSRARAARR